MKTQLIREQDQIESRIDQSRAQIRGSLGQLRERVSDLSIRIRQSREARVGSFLLLGAVVVMGLAVFYDRGSKKQSRTD